MTRWTPLVPETIKQLKGLTGRRRRFALRDPRATPAAVARFALALGDDNPLWWSDDASEGALRSVPPTFLYTGINFGDWPDFNGAPPVKSQATQTLWAGDAWSWSAPLARGEAFDAQSEIIEVVEQSAGASNRALISEHIAFTGLNARPLATLRRDTIVLGRPQAAQAAIASSVYTPAELQAIEACYRSEPARRRGPRRPDDADIATGAALGPMVKGPLTINEIISFAIAWGGPLLPTGRILSQWLRDNPDAGVRNSETGALGGVEGMHWDPTVWRALGYDRGVGFGPQTVSWFAHLLTDWAGDHATPKTLHVQLRRPIFIGDATWLNGKVTTRSTTCEGEWAAVEIEARNQRGELTARGTATVLWAAP